MRDTAHVASTGVTDRSQVHEKHYTGYMEYPFENKQRKIRLLNLPFEVDKEEMIGEVVINSAFLKWIFHVASTTEILRISTGSVPYLI